MAGARARIRDNTTKQNIAGVGSSKFIGVQLKI
jgi:hypothetical protein